MQRWRLCIYMHKRSKADRINKQKAIQNTRYCDEYTELETLLSVKMWAKLVKGKGRSRFQCVKSTF